MILIIGIFPGRTMSRFGEVSLGFLQGSHPHHLPIAYFSMENLKGAVISLSIGGALFGLLVLARRMKLRSKETAEINTEAKEEVLSMLRTFTV